MTSPSRNEERLDWISLARTRRKIAHQYARWAREEEARGRYQQFADYLLEARRLRGGVRFAIEMARRLEKYT